MVTSQLSLRLPEALLDDLDHRAKRHNRTRAEEIRIALTAYVALPEGAFDLRASARVNDLIGSVDGLPRGHADSYLAEPGRHTKRSRRR